MANVLNQENIVSTEKAKRNIPNSDIDPLANYSKLVEGKSLNLAFQPVGSTSITEAIRKLNQSSSMSMDGISMKLVKQIQIPFIPVLTYLVNSTIIASKYPEVLKRTKIIPQHKKGKYELNPSSYRGINLIPYIGKIINKILLDQLLHQ